MKKKTAIVMAMTVLMAGLALGWTVGVVFVRASDGTGYYVGKFYKDTKTNYVYKVMSETKDETRLGFFESGELALDR